MGETNRTVANIPRRTGLIVCPYCRATHGERYACDDLLAAATERQLYGVSVTRDVTPMFKENQGRCQCGRDSCTAYGTLKKPWADGKRCVARKCACPRCRGRTNRSKGDRKAAQARRALGAMGANSRHEEHWTGALRIEAKAGAQVGPILTRYLAAKNQSEAARPRGDNRPFVMAAMPDRGPGLLVVEIDELAQVVAALLENWQEAG